MNHLAQLKNSFANFKRKCEILRKIVCLVVNFCNFDCFLFSLFFLNAIDFINFVKR